MDSPASAKVETELSRIPTEDARGWAEGVREVVGRLRHRRDVLATQLAAETSRTPQLLERLEAQAERSAQSQAEIQALEGAVAEKQRSLLDLRAGSAAGGLFRALDSSLFLEKSLAYVKALRRLALLDEELRHHLGQRDHRRLLPAAERAQDLCRQLSRSAATHLAAYAQGFWEAWRLHLAAELSKRLDAGLEKLGWPFDSLQSIDPASPTVGLCADLVAVLALCGAPDEEPVYLEPLLGPFQRRFHYHFYGERKTNDAAHPEWFLSQVLEWLALHRAFVREQLQPGLPEDQAGLFRRLAVRLVRLAAEKVRRSLGKASAEPGLLAHLIDEVLAFERDLAKAGLGALGLSDAETCLGALTEGEGLEQWLGLERVVNTEKAEELLSSPSAWETSAVEAAVEDRLVPEAVSSFLLLLQCIGDRYRGVPSVQARHQFFLLQLSLLDDFRTRLVQIVRHCDDPWAAPFPQLLNGLAHLCAVLRLWNEEPLYVRLMAEKERPEGLDGLAEETGGKLLGLPGAFDGMLQHYQHLWTQMLRDAVDYALQQELRPRLSAYLYQEKWHAMEWVEGVSGSLCPLLLGLSERLGWLEERVGRASLGPLAEGLAKGLLQSLLDDLVLKTSFSEGGGAQLSYDVLVGLIPLLASYEVPGLSSSSGELAEAATILGLKRPVAGLLAEALDSGAELGQGLGLDFDVRTLSKAQVRQLLRQRLDLASFESDQR